MPHAVLSRQHYPYFQFQIFRTKNYIYVITYNIRMKKLSSIILILFLFICLSAILASCSSYDRTFSEISSRYADLAKDAEFTEKRGNGNGETVIDFGKTVTLNRLVLREKTDSVTSFTLRLPSSPSPFYGNDYIGGYRYCSFPAVTTDKIVLSVESESSWSLDDAEAYYVPLSDMPFDVTAYITAKTAYSLPETADTPADTFNLFYSVYLDKNGDVRLPDYFIDDVRIEGETVLSTGISNIRAAYPKAKIVATVLGDKEFDGDGLTLQQRYSSAFENGDRLSSSLIALVNAYGLDGISFDYEYPVSEKDYSLFADFCTSFRKQLPQDKMLSSAVSAWCIDENRMSVGSLDCFDRVILMAYDCPDAKGCHSTFYTVYSQIKKLKEKGFPLYKTQLGLPLYSKPVDGSTHWISYSDYADGLSIFANSAYADCDGERKLCYFNGRQLIADKTNLSLDLHMAGVAVWHYSLDSSDPALSLLHTVYRTVHPRNLK